MFSSRFSHIKDSKTKSFSSSLTPSLTLAVECRVQIVSSRLIAAVLRVAAPVEKRWKGVNWAWIPDEAHWMQR